MYVINEDGKLVKRGGMDDKPSGEIEGARDHVLAALSVLGLLRVDLGLVSLFVSKGVDWIGSRYFQRVTRDRAKRDRQRKTARQDEWPRAEIDS